VIVEVYPPEEGLWHVGRDTSEDLTYRTVPRADDTNPRGGNRYDSYSGTYGTLYFATDLEVCYCETLARFRPNVVLAALVKNEWEASHKMGPGSLPADWRHTRVASRVLPVLPLPFVDVTHAETIAALNLHADLMAGLARFGVSEIDLGQLAGKDRRVTRYIAEFLAAARDDENLPKFSGIRYMSRLGEGYECWGLFEGTEFEVVERRSIERNSTELVRVARIYEITIH
jgi:hypothetical protein